MNTPDNKEIQARGKILALSLQIEDCLNSIIFVFFLPKSKDQEIKNLFLRSFVMNNTFGGKVELYKKIIQTKIYQKKIKEQLNLNPNKYTINTLSKFLEKIKYNLSQILSTRNHVAHGTDVSKGFLTLEEGETILMNNFKLLKTSEETIDQFSQLVEETLSLLNIADARVLRDL